MATLNKEYHDFNKNISLTKSKKDSLIKSRNSLKKKIKEYFKEEKSDELQPKFHPQGSTEMNTTVNPIVEYDDKDNVILKYDLDYGIYFIEKQDEDNKQSINTWHDWVFNAVENHTDTPPKRKNTCIRVYFSDGHHIDLPIYYKKDDNIELAHKSKGWIFSDPKEFFEWFNNIADKNEQIRRVVRYLKAWKNYREFKNSRLRLPSGFELTILAVSNYFEEDNDDDAFRSVVKNIKNSLELEFKCLRPTTPVGEDVFANYSETQKNDFLNALDVLLNACNKAKDEKNFKKATEELRKQFGNRFPLGVDEDEEDKSSRYETMIGIPLAPKPYAKQ